MELGVDDQTLLPPNVTHTTKENKLFNSASINNESTKALEDTDQVLLGLPPAKELNKCQNLQRIGGGEWCGMTEHNLRARLSGALSRLGMYTILPGCRSKSRLISAPIQASGEVGEYQLQPPVQAR
jgi:hypothetical protein